VTGITPSLVAFLGAASVFVLLVGVWYPAHARARGLRRRIESLSGGAGFAATDMGGRRRITGSFRLWTGGNRIVSRIERRVEMAGLDLTAGELIAAAAIFGATAALLSGVVVGPLAIVPAALAAAALPFAWLSFRRRRRSSAFLRQLPDTVGLLASAVRAGHSLMQGLEQVAKEALEPTRSALEQVVREIGLGAPLDESLERLAKRFPSEDLDLIITSIGVQQQVGGSLALILDDMADTLRDRERINGEIAALTAPQRYSAYVLALLPVCVTGAIYLISRDYMSALFEGPMRLVVAAAALMVVLGFLIMRKMASINV
jgi:tight adherence protein B